MRSDNLKSHMKKHGDFSSENQEQICKIILESNDIPETSLYTPKVNYLTSDGMDKLRNFPSMYRKKNLN